MLNISCNTESLDNNTNIKRIVDTSNLRKGMVAKNYKEMCYLIGCEPCKGNGTDREYQIKNWQRYFNFEKLGHKFIITKVNDTPLPVTDCRRVKEGKYNKYIEPLLMEYLSFYCKSHEVVITKRELYTILGMVNENYIQLSYNNSCSLIQEAICPTIDVKSVYINNFHQRVEDKLSRTLYNTLDSMQKRNLIRYHKQFIISIPNSDDSGGFEVVTVTPYQEQCILTMQQSVLDEFGYTNISQVALAYKTKEFYRRVNECLREVYGWLGYYTQIYITQLERQSNTQCLLSDDISGLLPSVQREQFNQFIISEIEKQAYSKYKKSQNRSIDELLKDRSAFQYNEEYLESQSELADYLLNIKRGDNHKQLWLAIDKRKEK